MKRVLVPLLLVVFASGCTGSSASLTATTGSGASPSGGATPTATASTSASASPSAAASASSTPTATPAPSVAYTCGFPVNLTGTVAAENTAVLADVRVGTHPADGYDRITFEFAGTTYPGLAVDVAHSPFTHDPSGLPFTVSGSSFLGLRMTPATRNGGYAGTATIEAPSTTSKVRQLVEQGDFEGIFTWVVGLSGTGCIHVSTLSAPTRIVIDIQTP